ncbi:hypothetical protein [Acuticoccus kandeliae]|uniref:hypothetical protein n=1 Tax=Acuticoccus kandeliae TaxID=2073160 RepID=UPI000D3E5BB3|nr:hypothetical protein [Acuticoccus kandeliae]
MAIFTTATAFLMRPILNMDPDKTRKDAARFLKARFDPDHFALSRDEEHFVREERAVERESAARIDGESVPKRGAEAVAWREWRWSEACTINHCTWKAVRWRFYENGRIAFQAEMENSGTNMRVGNLQGHRIELRTTDGCLLGAWHAAFFVRRSSGICHFPATIAEDHPLLAEHYGELAERQTGICFHQ